MFNWALLFSSRLIIITQLLESVPKQNESLPYRNFVDDQRNFNMNILCMHFLNKNKIIRQSLDERFALVFRFKNVIKVIFSNDLHTWMFSTTSYAYQNIQCFGSWATGNRYWILRKKPSWMKFVFSVCMVDVYIVYGMRLKRYLEIISKSSHSLKRNLFNWNKFPNRKGMSENKQQSAIKWNWNTWIMHSICKL